MRQLPQSTTRPHAGVEDSTWTGLSVVDLQRLFKPMPRATRFLSYLTRFITSATSLLTSAASHAPC